MQLRRTTTSTGAFWVALTTAGITQPAEATTMRLASPERLASLADVVLVAKVQETTTHWRGQRIVSEHQIAVLESWKGDLKPGHNLRVQTLGGVIGLIGQKVAGAARLSAGETVVLYLVRAESDVWRSVGMWQGVFHVEQSAGRPTLYRAPDGSRVTDMGTDPFPTVLDDLRWTAVEVVDDP